MGSLPNGYRGDIEIVRRSDVEGDNNRGWQADLLTVSVDGEAAGYALLTYIPQARGDLWYPQGAWDLLRKVDGKVYLPETPLDPGIDLDELSITLRLRGRRDIHKDQREEFARCVSQTYSKHWETFRAYTFDRPKMDFIRVYRSSDREAKVWDQDANHIPRKKLTDFRKLALGELLYRESAIWLAESGLKLHSSGLIEPEAHSVWNTLARDCSEAIWPETRDVILASTPAAAPKLILDGSKLPPWLPNWARTACLVMQDGERVNLIGSGPGFRL